MLAIHAPGSQGDIAPGWLAREAAAHTKQEYQITQRAGKGEGRGKSEGGRRPKVKGKGGGRGRAPAVANS